MGNLANELGERRPGPGLENFENRSQTRRRTDRPAELQLIQSTEVRTLMIQRIRGPAGKEFLLGAMRLHQRRSQDPNFEVTGKHVEVMDPITEAVLVAKELRQGAHHEMKRTAALVGIAPRLHAHLGKRFRNSLGIL